MVKSFMTKKKGITPIIAVIILLLITIALAGAAYSYMSAYWTSITGKNIMLLNSYCTGGNTANVLIRNSGTMKVTLSDVSVINTITGKVISPANWTNTEGTQIITNLDPGKTGKFNATCSNYCTYRFIYGGAIGIGVQTISVSC